MSGRISLYSGIVEEKKLSVKDRIAMFSKGSTNTAPPLQKRHTVTSSQLKSFQPKPVPAPAPAPASGSGLVKPSEGSPRFISEKKVEPKPIAPKLHTQHSEPVKEESGGFITHAKTEGPQVFGGVAFGSIRDNPFLKNQKKQSGPAPPPKKPLPSFVTQQKRDAAPTAPKIPVQAPKPTVPAPVSKPEPQITPKPAPAPVQTSSISSVSTGSTSQVERTASATGADFEAIGAARKKALAMFGGGGQKAQPPKPKWKAPKTAADYRPKEVNLFEKKPEEKPEPKVEKKVEFVPQPELIQEPIQKEVVKPVDPLFAETIPQVPKPAVEPPKPQKQVGKISSPFFQMEKNQGKSKQDEHAEQQRKSEWQLRLGMEEISALRKEKEVQIFENGPDSEEEDENETNEPKQYRHSTSVKRNTEDFTNFKAKLAAQFGQRAGFANRPDSDQESEEDQEKEEDDDDYDEPAQPANPMMMISAQVGNVEPSQDQPPQGGIFDQLEQVDEAPKDQLGSNDMLFNKPAARKSKKAAVIFDEDDDQDFA